MGARLAQYALGPWWAHLDPAPRCLLAIMAATVLDVPKKGTPAGLFFQSRDALILNYYGIDVTSPRYESSDRRIRRYLETLIDAGAIRRVKAGRRGQHAEYELLVDPLRTCQDTLPDPDDTPLAPVVTLRHRGAESVPLRGAESVPLTH